MSPAHRSPDCVAERAEACSPLARLDRRDLWSLHGERPEFQGDLGRVRALPGPLPEPNEVDRARRGAPGSEAGSRGHAGTLRRAQRPPRSTWENQGVLIRALAEISSVQLWWPAM